ncbi:putative cation efflux protein [Streptomyces sp. NBRC 110611]|uniref:cation diffusion facilitator family transporter n=1 Tax=Streptomyces sp. NBRC 110611 TaxID=1621259 RepID=UPI00082A46D8|nr:cation diffusion facilitator family transporter [Streptomyces sp. NBRC 110611]GAU66558.1 putative cation efflux protein [Streptomyces sp. NBRC 110611]
MTEHAHSHTDSQGHGHSHSNGHSHSHAHGVAPNADRRWLRAALILLTAYMAVEVAIGVIAQSLALISDAAHMLTDAVSIVLALIAMRLAARPARGGYTYGLKRAEILSAQANGITLLLLSVWLAYEAVDRLIEPPEVAGGLVLVTALSGIVVNLICVWLISKANRSSLNVEGAYQHILTDLFGFIATAVSGLVVMTTGFAQADSIASLVVVALMLKAGTGLVRESGRIFMEAAPAGIDPDAIGDHLVAQDQVVEIHDLHIWQITSGQPALSAHILVAPGGDCHKVRRGLQALLSRRYGITHATLQVDHVGEDGDADDVLILGPRPDPGTTDPAPHATDPASSHCEDAHGPVHRPGPHEH